MAHQDGTSVRAAGSSASTAITALVLVIVPFLLYFTPWYAAGLHSAAVRELTYAALMVPGLVFFWTLLRVDPVPKAYPYLVSLWVTGAEVVGDAVLGLAIIADEHLIAGSHISTRKQRKQFFRAAAADDPLRIQAVQLRNCVAKKHGTAVGIE